MQVLLDYLPESPNGFDDCCAFLSGQAERHGSSLVSNGKLGRDAALESKKALAVCKPVLLNCLEQEMPITGGPLSFEKRIKLLGARFVWWVASDFFLWLLVDFFLLLVLDFVGVLFLAFFFRFFSTLVAHGFAPVKSCFFYSAHTLCGSNLTALKSFDMIGQI